MPDFSIAGIILAAGESRRMGSPKALLTYRGRYFIDIILANLQTAACFPIMSILGMDQHLILRNTQAASFISHVNPHPYDGMLSSIRIAIKHLPSTVQGFILALVDHPLVAEKTYRLLRETASEHPYQIIIPSHKGRHGHPLYFGRPFFSELLSAPDTMGARAVVQQHRAEVRYLEVNDPGILQDIDTPQQYSQLIP